MPKPSILVVEDESIIALGLKMSLEGLGYDVPETLASGEEAIEFVEHQRPDLVLMDVHLKGELSGTEAARIIYEKHQTPIVFLTAYSDDKTLNEAAFSAPMAYLLKPYSERELMVTLRFVLDRSRHLPSQTRSSTETTAESETPPQNGQSKSGEPQHLLGRSHQVVDETLESWLSRLGENDCTAIEQQLKGGETVSALVPSSSDEKIWIDFTAFAYRASDMKDAIRVIAIFREVQSSQDRETRLSTLRLNGEAGEDCILVTNSQGQILSVNKAFIEQLLFDGDTALGNSYLELLQFENTTGKGLANCLNAHQDFWQTEGQIIDGEGMPHHVVERGYLVYGPSQQAEYVVVVLQDLKRLESYKDMVSYMAYHDELTGLGNRFLLEDHLALEINRAHRKQSGLTLAFIDLDQFKPINDHLGHDAGDEVLRELGKRFKARLRDVDTAVRLGGDEFIVVAPEVECREGAAALADKILSFIEEPITLSGGETVTVSASIGLALYPDHARSSATLIKSADRAMYSAKEAGKARYAFFDSSEGG